MNALISGDSDRHRGFTLVEALVSLIVVAVMIMLFFPWCHTPREAVRRNACLNKLRNCAMAALDYEKSQRLLPPGNVIRSVGQFADESGKPVTSREAANWALAILPYLGEIEEPLCRKYDDAQLNVSAANAGVRATQMPIYHCPSDTTDVDSGIPASGPGGAAGLRLEYAFGSYRAMSGRSDGFQFLDNEDVANYPQKWRGAMHVVGVHGFEQEKLAGINDGLSKTILVGESTGSSKLLARHTFWAYSYTSYSLSAAAAQLRVLELDYEDCVAIGGQGSDEPCKRNWSSSHPHLFNMGFCDGSVRPLTADIDPALFASLSTIDGGESEHEIDR